MYAPALSGPRAGRALLVRSGGTAAASSGAPILKKPLGSPRLRRVILAPLLRSCDTYQAPKAHIEHRPSMAGHATSNTWPLTRRERKGRVLSCVDVRIAETGRRRWLWLDGPVERRVE